MKRLFDLAIDRPVATCMMLLCLMVLGVVAIFRLPLDNMPLIQEPEIDIEVPFSGSHPLETLRDVAIPIEEEIATIPEVKRISTRATSGQARVEVNFDWDVNLEVKRMEVREAVERARAVLPEGIGFIEVKGDIAGPADGAMLQGRVSAERDLSESWELLDRRIKRPIERIKGVASVSLYGVEPQQIRIDLDFEAMQNHGVRADQILDVINAANLDMDLGTIRGDIVRYDVRTVARFTDLEEIRDLSIGRGLRVRDVARVESREPEVDYGRHLDQRFAIGIDVFKEPTANTVATVDAIMAKIDEIESDPALQGISLLVWANAGEEIRTALGGLRDAGIFGGFLAVFVLYFFLRKLRNTLIVAVAIPFSLIVTCGGMYALGSEFNVLTLMGLMLGVGMLVDNAVVVMENIHRLQSTGMDPRTAAKRGARDVAMAVTASTATTVIVWSWLFTADKSELTIMMTQTALTICLAVVCSLLVSLTLIPLAAARIGTGKEAEPGFLLRRLVPVYRGVLGFTLRHRVFALVVLLGIASTAIIPIQAIEKTGEPSMQQYSVQINLQVHDPATKDVLESHIDTLEAFLAERKEELGYESMYSWYSENMGCMTRLYLPRGNASKDKLQKLRDKLEGKLPEIAGVKLQVGDSEWYRRGRGGDGRRMVSVSITGEDPEYLEQLAIDAEARLRGIPQAVEVWGPSLSGQKELRLLVDPARARALSVTPSAIADAVSFAFRGRNMRRYQTANGELEMLIGLPEELRDGGMALLNELEVPTSPSPSTAASTTSGASSSPTTSATMDNSAETAMAMTSAANADTSGDEAAMTETPSVPLSSVVDFEIARMPPRIQRTDRETTSRVSVQFDEDDVTTEEAQALVSAELATFTLPEGYRWSFGDWGRRRDDNLGTMFRGVTLSLLIVVLLMAALFESFSQPLAIVITLPFAFFGGFWALWLLGYELDAVGFIGVIILIGVVVNNGIVMVDHVNHLRAEGKSRLDALLEGCGNRLRPVLMTAITTIFGLVPLALAGSSVGGAYIDSLAVVVIGGLATSTVFTLLALPVWYTAVEDIASILLRLLPRPVRSAGRLWPRGSVLARSSNG